MSRATEFFRLNRPSFSRAADFVSRASEWLVLTYLLVVTTPVVLVHPRSLTYVRSLNLLDGSWLLDTTYKASGGIWFGRDVAFTYGPLFQWLSSAPARWIGVSTGNIYATWYTLPSYLIILATFLAARLLLPKGPAWRRALLVYLAVVYWSMPDLRASLCVLAFAVLIRLIDGAASGTTLLPAVAAAAICATAFLVSADTGLYCVAAVVLCVGATAVVTRSTRDMTIFLVQAAIAFGVMVLTINAVMFSPLDFRFWRSSLAIAIGYRWFEPLAMAKFSKHLVMKILAVGLSVFVLAAVWRRPRRNWTARPAFLLAGFLFALVTLQAALVRSDYAHVLVGTYAMVFLCGVIVLDRFDSGLAGAVSALAVAVATVALVPTPMIRPGNLIDEVRRFWHPMWTCPAGPDLDGACLIPHETQWLSDISAFANLHAGPGDPIAVLPYQTAFGLLSRHQVAGGVMQSYLVNGDYLTALDLRGLEAAKPPVALYFPESGIDSVPTLTRNGDAWFYYLRHYRLAEPSPSGVVGLVRDDGRVTRIRTSVQAIGSPLPPVKVSRRNTTFDLGQLRWPTEGADFLKLRVRVDYPFWWRLRKPSAYVVQMSFADGSQKSLQFVLQPGRATDIWVYPWDDETLGSYFSSDEVHWRAPNRPAVASLKLLVTPHDWISVVPKSVAVESIEAVRVDLQ